MGLFKKAFNAITRPVRSVAKTISNTAAGLFKDVTDPFLAPIDSILDAISPRFRLDASVDGQVNIAGTVSGSTTHQILFPQLPHAQGVVGDVSGGLLSDLAINTDALRRAETELEFLHSAMRKGVYPHRGDTLHFGIAATPIEKFDADVWLRVVATDIDEDRTLIEHTVLLSKEVISAKLNTLKRAPAGTTAPYHHEMAEELEVEEVVQLPATRGSKFRLQVVVEALDSAGKPAPALFAKLAELDLWIERRNRGFSEVLHRISCDKPTAVLTTAFPIDRCEYISKGKDYEMTGIAEKEGLTGGAFAPAVGCLESAIAALGSVESPPQAKASSNPLAEAVALRIQRSDRARECLWQARQALARLQSTDGESDFRLRYKLRIENLSTKGRKIDRLSFHNGAPNGGQTLQFEVNQVDLPPMSTYEITIYPLNSGHGASSADIKLAETHPHCVFTLIGGLGTAESALISRSIKAPSAGATDSARLSWMVNDCAVPRKS